MLEELKAEVVRIAKKAQNSGLCKHKAGNVSALDPGTGLVCITPSGVDRDYLTPDQVCVVDFDLNCIEGGRPSSETLMHIECYKERPDIRAIVHTHSAMASAFACLNRPIPSFIFELFVFHLDNGVIPVAPYALPGTMDLARSVAETVKRSDLVLMERHGTIAVGGNLNEAYENADYIEELAKIYYTILTLNNGQDCKLFTPEDFRKWKYPDQIKSEE
ncbi:MAG: class II aldolase/adducin family protein [Solobacterium sp.]|nr:class II aldolase/adducin family protein [Erysipelotrichaceae bacterium]MBQ6592343.1 class II aldolase/adducin family protein [Solobacterium sp.]MBR0478764.1 class II aldolase/adducin family protein [Solobacterium sp.]